VDRVHYLASLVALFVREIKDLHLPFIAYLERWSIPYIYHWPGGRSGINKGHPDFTISYTKADVFCWNSRCSVIQVLFCAEIFGGGNEFLFEGRKSR
jgi:hypothetical protein